MQQTYRSILHNHCAVSIRVSACLACSANFSAIKNGWFSWATCFCVILFRIRKKVFGGFRNIKSSDWGRKPAAEHKPLSGTNLLKRAELQLRAVKVQDDLQRQKNVEKYPKNLESVSFQSSSDLSWRSRGSWNFKNHVSWDSHWTFGHESCCGQIRAGRLSEDHK